MKRSNTTSRLLTLIQAILLIFLFTSCNESDFTQVTEWEDDNSSRIDSSDVVPTNYNDMPGKAFRNAQLATVTVLNFISTPAADKVKSYQQSTDQKMLTKIKSLLAYRSNQQRKTMKTALACKENALAQCILNELQVAVKKYGIGLAIDKHSREIIGKLSFYKELSVDMRSRLIGSLQSYALAYHTQQDAQKFDSKSLGSGSFVTFPEYDDENLYVITNNHVVDRDFAKLLVGNPEIAYKYKILYSKKTDAENTMDDVYTKYRADATLISRDDVFDISLLKIDDQSIKKDVAVMPIGDERDSNIMDTVVSLGSPHGFTISRTEGRISNLKRHLSGVTTYLIQHAALIDSGNSGGPLINMKGEMIGLNTYGTYDKFFYAIPASMINDYITKKLLKNDRSYYASSFTFDKIPVYQKEMTLASYFGKTNAKGLTNTRLFLVAQDRAFPDAEKTDLEVGMVFDRYKIDGVERAINSVEEMNLFIRYALKGKMMLHVLNKNSDGSAGRWINAPLLQYISSNTKSISDDIAKEMKEVQEKRNQDISSKITKKIKIEDKTLSYYQLSSASGKFVEYPLNGQNVVLYLSDSKLWVIDRINSQSIENISDVHSTIKAVLATAANQKRGNPPITLTYRNLKKDMHSYNKYYLERELKLGKSSKASLYNKVLDSMARQQEMQIIKLSEKNLAKLFQQYGLVGGDQNQKMIATNNAGAKFNKQRFEKSLMPWALGSLLSLYNHSVEGQPLDGSYALYQVYYNLINNFTSLYKYVAPEIATNCLSSLGSILPAAGSGQTDDLYRICFNNSATTITKGEVKIDKEQEIAVFRNRLAQNKGEEIDYAKFNVNKNYFDTFSNHSIIKIKDLIKSSVTLDLAKDYLSSNITLPFYKGDTKAKKGLFTTLKSAFIRNFSPEMIYVAPGKISGPTPRQNFVHSLNGQPGFFRSYMDPTSNSFSSESYLLDEHISGQIYDIDFDKNGNKPKSTSFHMFVPTEQADLTFDKNGVYSPEAWKELKMNKHQFKEGMISYKLNPEMNLTVIDLNMKIFDKGDLKMVNEKMSINPTQAKLYIFTRKERIVNQINEMAFIALEAEAGQLELFSPDGDLYRCSDDLLNSIHHNSCGSSHISTKERKANTAKRWIFRGIFDGR